MSLTDQISSLLGFSSRAEAQLKSIADAQAKSSELAAQVSELTGKVSKAESDLAAANTANDKQAAKIAELEAKVSIENKRATDTIAAQGIDPASLPATALAAASTTGASKPSKRAEYQTLLRENPRAAGAFYAENAAAIAADRN